MKKIVPMALSCILFFSLPLFASDVETGLESGMMDSLVESGVNLRAAGEIAQRFMFMGTVMIRSAPRFSAEDGETLAVQAEKIGKALGRALGNFFMIYGEEKLQDTATVMMRSVRAGLDADAASYALCTLAAHKYTFDAAASLLHETSELARSVMFQDNGAALCAQIRRMAAVEDPVNDIKKEIYLAARKEIARQQALLAQKENERVQHGGEGGKSASRSSGSARGASANAGQQAGGGGSGASGSNAGGSSNSSPSGGGSAAGSGGSGGGASVAGGPQREK
jgi:hypothetical protein